jgi:hypothetical protein
LTLLNEGCILLATPYPVPIDLAMTSNTKPLNSTKSLHLWRVMEAVLPGDIRTHHVCGEDANSNAGISTSAIQEFDPVAMTVKTLSGRTYILVGPSDNCSLGDAAWRKWCNDNGVVAEQEVTSQYMNTGSAPTITDPSPENDDPSPTITFKRLGFRYEETPTG